MKTFEINGHTMRIDTHLLSVQLGTIIDLSCNPHLTADKEALTGIENLLSEILYRLSKQD